MIDSTTICNFASAQPSVLRVAMAAALLAGLPSRGLISAERPSLRGAPAVYVSVTDTSPPPGQEITTDTTHILVRALAVKKAREEKKTAATNEEAAAKRQKVAAELEGKELTAELVRTFTIDKLKVSCLGGAWAVGRSVVRRSC